MTCFLPMRNKWVKGTDNALQYKQDPNKNTKEPGSWISNKRFNAIYSDSKSLPEDTKCKREERKWGYFHLSISVTGVVLKRNHKGNDTLDFHGALEFSVFSLILFGGQNKGNDLQFTDKNIKAEGLSGLQCDLANK